MKISPFHALTILAQKYHPNNVDTANEHKFSEIKKLFLMGIQTKADWHTLDGLIDGEEALQGYQVGTVSDEEFALLREERETLETTQQAIYDQALEKINCISNDPRRRYFESILCHETVKFHIDELDINLLTAHFEQLYAELNIVKRKSIEKMIWQSDDVNNPIVRISDTAPEYLVATSKLKDIKNFRSFEPQTGTDNQTPEQILKDRTDKMRLITKVAQVAMTAVHTAMTKSTYPLNVYDSADSPYEPSKRGRLPKIDENGQKQTVKSNNLGIMRSYHMPMPGDDALYEPPTMFMANQYRRCPDGSTFVIKAEQPQQTFQTQVSPFVTSISGTMLCQLRVIAKLLEQQAFQYANNPEQFKSFMRMYVAFMIYNFGGHSLLEFTNVWHIPLVQQTFKDIPGFQDLNLYQLFQVENDDSFMSAMNKTIEYTQALQQRDLRHQELLNDSNIEVTELTEIEQEIKASWDILHNNYCTAEQKSEARLTLFSDPKIKNYYKQRYCNSESFIKVNEKKVNNVTIEFQHKHFDTLSAEELEKIIFQKLSEESFLHDEMSRKVRTRLKPVASQPNAPSFMESVDKALNILLDPERNPELDEFSAKFLIKRINLEKRLQHQPQSIILNDEEDIASLLSAFQHIRNGNHILPPPSDERNYNIHQSVYQFMDKIRNKKEEQYYDASTETISLASRLDKAWTVYCDEQTPLLDKQIAKEFLFYILDLKHSATDTDEILIAAMQLRAEGKRTNPDYIPGLSPLPISIDMSSLAKKLDAMWEIYNDQHAPEAQRLEAQAFLIYALNIQNPAYKLNAQLKSAMTLRESLKQKHPNFVPGRSPLPNNGIDPRILNIIKRTQKFHYTENATIKSLFANKDLLDVTNKSKIKDQGGRKRRHKKTVFYTAIERDYFRVNIHNGLFVKKRTPISTKHSSSHDKGDYASFTLDPNGQLAIFPHISHDKTGIAHSSLTAGAPVICAGEVKIEAGKLKAITTHSGHYRPSLYNMYKALEYFEKRGVDISETKLLSFSDPKTLLNISSKSCKKYPRFYESNAQDLLQSYKAMLRKELHDIKLEVKYYKKSRSGLWAKLFFNSQLTAEKIKLAEALINFINKEEKALNKKNDLEEYQVLLQKLNRAADKFNEKNQQTSDKYHGSEGNFASLVQFFKQRVDLNIQKIANAKQADFNQDVSSSDIEKLKSTKR